MCPELHADGRDLAGRVRARCDPHARVLVEAADVAQPERDEGIDHQLLDLAHVRHGVGHAAAALAGYGADRVADELARPVVGDVAPAVGADEVGADVGGRDEHVAEVGAHAERVYVGVLEQQEVVVGAALEQRPLQVVGLGVGNGAEPADAEAPIGRGHEAEATGGPRRRDRR